MRAALGLRRSSDHSGCTNGYSGLLAYPNSKRYAFADSNLDEITLRDPSAL